MNTFGLNGVGRAVKFTAINFFFTFVHFYFVLKRSQDDFQVDKKCTTWRHSYTSDVNNMLVKWRDVYTCVGTHLCIHVYFYYCIRLAGLGVKLYNSEQSFGLYFVLAKIYWSHHGVKMSKIHVGVICITLIGGCTCTGTPVDRY